MTKKSNFIGKLYYDLGPDFSIMAYFLGQPVRIWETVNCIPAKVLLKLFQDA